MEYFLAILGITIALGIFWFVFSLEKYSRQAEDEEELDGPVISIVALLKHPQRIEPIYVETAARKAWGADLGSGELEGPDGFVVGNEDLPTTMISYDGRMMMLNNFPDPYFADTEGLVDEINDLRLKKLVREHSAWMSIEAVAVDSFDDIDEVKKWYRILGPMLSELVDDNCLLIMLPLTGEIYPNMEETLEMLKSDDLMEALTQDAPVPVIQIPDDDPRMIAAVEKARSTWPEFVRALENQNGNNFSVKAPITVGDNTEFIWINVTAVENGIIYGELANEPVDLGNLQLGSRVRTKVDDLNDWAYFDGDQSKGLFTLQVLADAQKRKDFDK
ncbi:MAG: DUF2314 domain-containing protein [Planctomycetota bacterium]